MEDILGALEDLIDAAVGKAERSGAYMPAIATAIRLKADELAERYPDDVNGGFAHYPTR